MKSFINDIPSIEFFLVLFLLLLGSVALQAFINKRYLVQEDLKMLLQGISKWVIGLTLLVVGLFVIAYFIKY
jgi:hypothetical protein